MEIVGSRDLEAFNLQDGGMPLDPGIRRYVLILRSQGIETFESCEGGEGHCSPDPFVKFHGTVWAGFRAFTIAMEYGLPVWRVQLFYDVVNGMLDGPYWQMLFSRKDRPD